MKNIIHVKQIVIGTGLLLLMSSCNNWNDYYSTPDYTAKGSIFEALSNDPNYKSFIDIVLRTQADTILKRTEQMTVFALNNSAMAELSSRSDAELSAIIRMHIVYSKLTPLEMNNANITSTLGKLLKLRQNSGNYTVNGIIFNTTPTTTSNGLIYQIDHAIETRPNLFEVIQTHPDLTLFNKFIVDNYILIPDPENNVLTGYDTLNRPVYEEPVNYLKLSEILNATQADNEKVLLTAFLPSDAFVKKTLEQLLAAKNGHLDLIAPRLGFENSTGYMHGDTIVAGRYFRPGETFVGDTTALLNKLFQHVFVQDEKPFLNGTQIFTNVLNQPLTVSSGQVKADATAVSNGYYYIMNEINVPPLFYRNQFWLTPMIVVFDETLKMIQNPDISFFDNASFDSNNGQVLCYTNRFIRYNCRKPGAGINFKWPLVTPGKYNVVFSYFSDNNNIGMFDVTYGDQLLTKDLQTSGYNNGRKLLSVADVIGTIDVADEGEVVITFTCSKSNQGNMNAYQLCVDYLMLDPVD